MTVNPDEHNAYKYKPSWGQENAAARQNDQYYRLEALKLSRDIAVGNESPAITLDRAQKFYEFLYK